MKINVVVDRVTYDCHVSFVFNDKSLRYYCEYIMLDKLILSGYHQITNHNLTTSEKKQIKTILKNVEFTENKEKIKIMKGYETI